MSYEAVKENIDKVIKILRKDRQIALAVVGGHLPLTDPIAVTYGINSAGNWKELTSHDQGVLTKSGFTSDLYNAFIEWYDVTDEVSNSVLEAEEFIECRRLREEELRKLLSE